MSARCLLAFAFHHRFNLLGRGIFDCSNLPQLELGSINLEVDVFRLSSAEVLEPPAKRPKLG